MATISGDFTDSDAFTQQPRANANDKGGCQHEALARKFLLSAGLFGAAWIWGWVTNFPAIRQRPDLDPDGFVLSVLLFASYCLLPAGVKFVNSYAKLTSPTSQAGHQYTQPWVQHSSCSRSWLLPFCLQC
jgi:hypothetical protein